MLLINVFNYNYYFDYSIVTIFSNITVNITSSVIAIVNNITLTVTFSVTTTVITALSVTHPFLDQCIIVCIVEDILCV